MIIRLHPAVDKDLLEAMEYYDREAVPELAVEFYAEFRHCADEIGLRAKSFPVTESGLRRMNLHRFSFHILFEVLTDNEVEILVVKHHYRHPDFGTDRF